ncbi:MAG TPA: dTDP-4-dehydrorhamnose 3,5-epimerase [Ilumatobacter sp.]|nr:dTDP-4-dehydrorhamnose 3,5-epimerase [Ilumatobacter sp.]
MSVEIVDFDTRPGTIDGLIVVAMKQVTDERGTIRELFRRSAFEAAGVTDLGPFEQINITESRRGAIRGMHAEDMVKLLTVVAGESFGAYLDLRRSSPTFGLVETVMLRPGVQVLVPRGVANGFQAISDYNQYAYCFDQEWLPGMAGQACNPLDPELGIPWPIEVDPLDLSFVSAKDSAAPTFGQLAAS